MAGFGPVGATPVAALPGAGAAGVNYTPGTVTITYTGFGPTASYNFPPSRVSGLYVEVLHPGVSVARVSGLYVEVLMSTAGASAGGAGFVSILW